MHTLLQYVQEKYIKEKKKLNFNTGDTITIYYEIIEGDKTRIQIFKGVVIQIKGQGPTKTFTVRKISNDIGVERIFMLNQPIIQKIEINKTAKIRRSRIYYFRKLKGKKSRIKDKKLYNSKKNISL